MKKNNIKNPIKATIISSLVAPLPFIVKVFIADSILITELSGYLLVIMVFALPFTLVINFVLVLPIALVLGRTNYLSSIYLCLWCSLIAYPAFTIYLGMLTSGLPTKVFDFPFIIPTTLCGLCSGIVFCRIAKIQLKPLHLI